MNCRKVSHLLSAYMDGELAGVENLQIRQHLSNCDNCSEEYEDLLGTKRLLGRLKMQEPKHDLAGSIVTAIRIDTELEARRSLRMQIDSAIEQLKLLISAPQTLGVFVGVLAIAALYGVQRNQSVDHLHVVGRWDHSVPPASEFLSSSAGSARGRFLAPVRATSEPSMFSGNFSESQELPQFWSGRSGPTSVNTVDFSIH